MTRKPLGLDRRQFLKSATAAAAGVAAAPYIVPGRALGADGATPASERIVMGAIGLGGRGNYVMGHCMSYPHVQMVAVCDVQGGRRNNAKSAVDRRNGNADCKAYIDLRELLARRDIDAVMIATGDNWHSLASIMAMRAGKDVYSEKPASVTIVESRALVETVRRTGRVYQCGTQRRNVSQFQFAVSLAHAGKIGKLKTLYAEKAGSKSGVRETVLPAQPQPPREVMDWDLWLGPALWRPYNAQYYSRGFWSWHVDFSGGAIGEWGSHTVDTCQWANQSDDTMPVEYETINADLDVRCTYANGTQLIITHGLRGGSCPVKLVGEEGVIEVGDNGTVFTQPASLVAERRFRGGYPADDHVKEFLNCVKSRRTPSSHAEATHRSISTCHAANICVRLGRKVRWDPIREEFLNDEDANRLRRRAIREPWRI